MRFKRSNREHLTVALFPFLAVLICTFGVLIVQFVIVARSADESARKSRARENNKVDRKITQLNAQLDHQLILQDGFLSVHPELLQKLADQRRHQEYLRNQIAQIERDAKSLAKEWQRMKTGDQSLKSDPPDLDQQICALQAELAAEEKLLAEARAQFDSDRPVMYSVVPYSGPNGTKRRPIYVECTRGRITIHPHQITLTAKDFPPPLTTGNALDAALSAVRQYYLRNGLDDLGAPYPLLIVRPDGAEAYAVCRRAMENWDEEFGYELVTADKQLDFGPADDQLKQEIISAITAAKQRHVILVHAQQQATARRSSEETLAGGLTVSSQFGGFVDERGRQVRSSEFTERTITAQKQISRDSTHQDTPSGEVKKSSNRRSIASKRGEGWALPSRSEGAIGYRRAIRITCRAESMTLEPDASGPGKTITFQAKTEDAVLELVQSIWNRLDRWGIAGWSGYWLPELRFCVSPDGQERFEEIRQILDRSGLEIVSVLQ
jgi:hypothetical protein